MSLMSRIMHSFRNDLSATDPKAWSPSFWNLISGQTSSGQNVDEQTALTFSAVYCAISLISGTISSLPLNLIWKKPGKTVTATHKSIHRVMHTQWNKYMTAQIGREVMHAHILAWGNGYAEIVRDAVGNVRELWPIPPNRVHPEMKDGELVYNVQVDGRTIPLPRERVLHIPGLGFDGFMGYSVISLARQSIGMGLAMEEFGARFFSNGAHPGMVVSHPMKLSQLASENLSRELDKKYSGLGKAHRMMLLEEGMKMEKVGIPQEDSQFLESRQFQVPEIARWFNLPPHKLKDLTRSSFNNIESEQISFVTESLWPWVERLESNYDTQLLTRKDQDQGYEFKHIMEGLLRGDSKSRSEFYAKMWSIGAMNINEIREKEDMDPIEGGDRYFVPLNMVALDQFDKEKSNVDQPAKPTNQIIQ